MNKKFYVTPNLIVDAEAVAEAQYFPIGSTADHLVLQDEGSTEYGVVSYEVKNGVRDKSELRLVFKNPDAGSVTLSGEEADQAWSSFQCALDPDHFLET